MDRDRTRLVQREGDRSTLADREKVHRRVSVENRGDFTDKADARKDTNEARDLENSTRLYNNEIAHVRTDGVEGRNVAVLDKQGAADIRFRDDGKNEGQEMSEEEQRMDEDAQIKNGVLPGARLGGPERTQPLHKPQQLLQQNSLVRWERFLPQRQLRVLLVEDDDSTRHVVSALLRNCSYEVTSAANGLQAWELLENPASHFDLVLTEVVMQCLSGIGLLSKIMAHEGCKHIPVIMMSSHDSMGIVFKCLSKGAVDFLVKPVRKNELKNLWQHVWRRCHSSSGSGSGSGSQTQKVTRHKSGEVSGNNTDSNDESDNASSGLNIMDGSDNGSGTQSSWTKRVVEVESREQRDDWDLVHYRIGPSMEVPRQSRLEKLHRDWVQCGVAKKEFDYTMGQDLEIAMPAPAAAELKYLEEYKEPLDSACAVEEQAPSTSSGEGEHMGEEGVDTGFGGSGESSTEAIDLIGAIALKDKHAKEQGGSKDRREKGNNHTPNSNDKRGPELISPSLLELTLKRPRPMGEVEGEGVDRRVLRHSGSSAFSRYNTSVNHTPALSSGTFQINVISMPSGYGGHSFMQGSDILSSNPTAMHLAMQTGKFASVKGGCEMSTSHLSPRNGKQDISPPIGGKPGQDAFPGSMSIKEEPGSVSPVPRSGTPMPIPLPPPGILYDRVPAAYGSVHPVFYSQPGVSQWGKVSAHITERGEGVDHSGFHDHCHNQNRQSQMHHHSHHHSHHHHHHIQHHYHHHHQHKAQQRPSTPQQDEQTVTNDGTGAPRCGSSNMVYVAEGNNGQSGSSNGYGSNGNGNGSVNGSATGSNNASNGHNGQSAVALAAGGNGDSGTQNKNSGTGIGNAVITGNAGTGAVVGPDHNRSARREAALTKFRQKRKERCFEKKVRYQSRKRLAEQRPRVRGQFVRQSVYDSTAGEPE